MRFIMHSALILCSSFGAPLVQAREWHDSTGKYSVEADVIASTEDQVVLKRKDGKLVMLAKEKLSAADQEYLEMQKAANDSGEKDTQTWKMKSGLMVVGRLVAYGRKEVVIQRRRGKVYVNDRLFDNLPEVYQRMVPKIVEHFEKVKFDEEKDFKAWVAKLSGEPRRYLCEGVILELENGDEYGVPFIFFSEEDLRVLRPGWEQWLATQEDVQRRQEADFVLQAQAKAYQQDRRMNEQIAEMQLILSAVDAGVTDLWEVYLHPKPGTFARPQIVVVPGRDSRQAIAAALNRNPQYAPGPARKLN